MHLFAIKLVHQQFLCLAETVEEARELLVERYHDDLAEYIDVQYIRPEHFERINLKLDEPGVINLP